MKLDLTGQRFGRLTVIEERPATTKYKIEWLCKCDCGNYKIVKTTNLRRGATKSCGCLHDETVKNQAQMYPKDVRIKRLRHIWHGMIRRCNDKSQKYYYRYGGRGIKVCDEWNDYVVFARWALSNGYADELKIDRIDNDGNYEPGNCRWITEKEQHRNTSRNRYETINGVTKTIVEWAEEYNIRPKLLRNRLSQGMNIVEALTKERKWRGRGIPIRCIDTGEIFPSSTAAARKYNVNASSLNQAARTKRKSCGMRWEQIYDEIPETGTKS